MKIEDALKEIQPWLNKKGIEGVSQGEHNGVACITVFVSASEVRKILPAEYNGFKVVVEETGSFNAL